MEIVIKKSKNKWTKLVKNITNNELIKLIKKIKTKKRQLKYIDKIVGHNLSYKWHLFHEINLNKDIVIDPYLPLSINGPNVDFIKMITKTTQLIQMENFKDSIYKLSKNNYTYADIEIIEKYITLVFTNIIIVCDDKKISEILDSKLIIQMIKNDTYEIKQVESLINEICNLLESNTILINTYNIILEHKKKYIEKIENSTKDSIIFFLFPEILNNIITLSKQINCDKLTVKIRTMAPLFRNDLIKKEQEYIIKSINNGTLLLNNTIKLIDKIKNTNSKFILTNIVIDILYKISLDNKKWIKIESIPEILYMDIERLNNFRCNIRKNIINLSFLLVSKQFIDIDIKNDLVQIIDTNYTKNDTLTNIVKKIKNINENVNQDYLYKVLEKSILTNDNSIRMIFTKRYFDIIKNGIELSIHTNNAKNNDIIISNIKKFGLLTYKDEIIKNAKDISVYITHLDDIYQPLINNIMYL